MTLSQFLGKVMAKKDKTTKTSPFAPPGGVRQSTGLVYPCSSNQIVGAHGDLGGVANDIKFDRNGHFYARCPKCGSQHFFSRRYWTEHHGFTHAQARAMGLTIL